MSKRLNLDAALLDNSSVIMHIVKCSRCSEDSRIRELCVSFYTLIFCPCENNITRADIAWHEQTTRRVQLAISEITKKCEEGK